VERVAVYIDGANFFYGIKAFNKGYSDLNFDFEALVNNIVRKRRLVSVHYYNAPLKQGINSNLFKLQQQFFARLRLIENWTVVLCKRQRRYDDKGNHSWTIKGDDIHLAVDMLSHAYEDKYNTAILISGDGDFVPLVSKVKAKGKQVENYHFSTQVSFDLTRHCNSYSEINRKMANKFFYRPFHTISDTNAGKKVQEFLNNSKKKE